MVFERLIKYNPTILNLIIRRNMSSNLIVSEEIQNAGVLTINRPKALNAINLDMVRDITASLKAWENTKSLVIIKSEGGKSFCAGGDIKTLVQSEDRSMPATFMREEYTLNHLIGTYKIPYVALIDGITMGGGVGLSVHGKYRIATEKTMFAMPETAIGLFPDVGGCHALARLQGKLGIYLGLTGARLKGKDVLASGIATHYCDSSKLLELTEKLVECKSNDNILTCLKKFCIDKENDFSLNQQMNQINMCFNAKSVEEIQKNLEKDGTEWAKLTLNILSKMCPQSLKITHRQIEQAVSLSLAQCLQMDYRLVCRILPDYNFAEGVRAVLIDKKGPAIWKPSTLEELKTEYIESFFEKLPDEMELKLNREDDTKSKL